ncbi:Bug family tripartite tricarboxylate transporter substrate binding protein [Allopusillimonas ginsengisoli]|uniref:Bug family tripartite tricarboxylate transporter substrate binding protein n=1 Tax=Allopusillimonas ginsengisoli TaxID=453575 RepID=UPI001022531C|nr:tripartite tricarboxylate transporter substrate binding protein [Allopusillimonas ginsengisoli]TEA79052.1 tripartite tricarboxylate transporter substrate binding protein [Allopusillimonas ginsengisoli]
MRNIFRNNWRPFAFTLAVGMLSAAAPACASSSTWPASGKPITIVAPFSAGSGADGLVRRLAQQVNKETGVPVIVENKPGASTTIGADAVARAKPDGYTLLYTYVLTHAQNPHLFKKLPYDAFKDFTPILKVVDSATILAVNKDAPFDSMQALIEYARQHPGELNYGSYNVGSTAHLNSEILLRNTGIDAVHIPYKGSADALIGLLAGDIHFGFVDTATAVNQARAGKLKLFGTATDKRLAVLPDLPTLAEQGIEGLDIVGWQAIFAPGNVPDELAEQIAGVFRHALSDPEIVKSFESQGVQVSGAGPKEFASIVRRDYEHWGQIIKALDLKLDQ